MNTTVKDISLNQVKVSALNPRRHWDEVKLKELTDSIKEKGVLSPIILRQVNGKYEVVCGERRFKASQQAKLSTIPAIIRKLDDAQVLEIQIVENLQRDDLNSIEEAQGFKALLEKCKYTQATLATKTGKSQGYIAARLALLNLTEDFQKDIIDAKLLPGHVKYLMVISDRPKILTAIRKEMGNHKEQLTVKAFESIVSSVLGRQTKSLTTAQYGPSIDFNTKECKDCEFRRNIASSWGSPEKKCVNSDCFNKKQRLARKAKAERVKSKMVKGGVVEGDQLKDVEELKGYRCKFDIKTCKRCEKRKVAKIKESYNNKVKAVEVCTDKECFAKKNKEAEEAKEKQREQEFKKTVEKVKAKASHIKIDRNFYIVMLADRVSNLYDDDLQEAVKMAYNIKDDTIFGNRKKAIDYFTRNNKLKLTEILCFLTYWNN